MAKRKTDATQTTQRRSAVERYLLAERRTRCEAVRDEAEAALVRLLGEGGQTAGTTLQVIGHGRAWCYGWDARQRLGPDWIPTEPEIEMVSEDIETPEGITGTHTLPKRLHDAQTAWGALVRAIADTLIAQPKRSKQAEDRTPAEIRDRAEIEARAQRPDLWRLITGEGLGAGRLADTWAAAMTWAAAADALTVEDDRDAMAQIDATVAAGAKALRGDVEALGELQAQIDAAREARRDGASRANKSKRKRIARENATLLARYTDEVRRYLKKKQPLKTAKAATVAQLAVDYNVTVKRMNQRLNDAGRAE